MVDHDVASLVARAGQGDADAWAELVERFASLVWNVARAHRLNATDAADVAQTVWLRLVEHLGRLREPAALAGWLVTTTRNESLRVLRRSGREVPDDDSVGTGLADRPSSDPGPEVVVLRDERATSLWVAVRTLNHRCQLLLRTLATVPEASYAEVSAALGMPIGSIGPTRSRCMAQLRRALQEQGVLAAGD